MKTTKWQTENWCNDLLMDSPSLKKTSR